MSKLGFDKILNNIHLIEKNFIKDAMNLAIKEFNHNFKTERNSETGINWEKTIRPNPPKILDVTGTLKNKTTLAISTLKIENSVFYKKVKATITIDPIDDRGRGYARYHQEGFKHTSGKFVVARKFVTQSLKLTLEQKRILEISTDRVFKGAGYLS